MAFKINTNIINDANRYVTDAEQVKGTYTVVSTFADLANLPRATQVNGSLAYTADTKKTYRYDGTNWVEESSGSGGSESFVEGKAIEITSVSGDLPEAYQEVEYIESSGTQYIDTGYKANQDTCLEIHFQYVAGGFSKCLFGSRTNSTPTNSFTFWAAQSGKWQDQYGSSKNITSIATDYLTHTLVKNKNNTYFDGVLIYTHPAETFANTSNQFLFALNEDNVTPVVCSNGKIIGRVIYSEGSDIVHEFVPCYKKSDGTIGMYDTKTDTFHVNIGTGVFIRGKDTGRKSINVKVDNETIKVNDDNELEVIAAGKDYQAGKAITITESGSHELPEAYQEVEYIESSQTQWIDTGFIPNQNTSIETKVSIPTTEGRWWFGTRQGSLEKEFGMYKGTSGATTEYDVVSCYGNDRKTLAHGTFSGDTVIIKKEKNIDTFENNGNTYTLTHTVNTFTCPYTLYLFNIHLPTVVAEAAVACKMYYFKIWDNDTLVRNLIPCYRKADNVIGMYDIENDMFYTNIGTGNFSIGDIIEDKARIGVKYDEETLEVNSENELTVKMSKIEELLPTVTRM